MDTKTLDNKEDVLKMLNQYIDKAESALLVDSSYAPEVNKFTGDAYKVLEVARLALRGLYHTK